MEFGGGEVDGDFFVGKSEEGVVEGGADAIFGLFDGFVGHADDIEGREATVGVTFDFDEVALVALG